MLHVINNLRSSPVLCMTDRPCILGYRATDFRVLIIESAPLINRWEVRVLLYKLYRYIRPRRIWVYLSNFFLKIGVEFMIFLF